MLKNGFIIFTITHILYIYNIIDLLLIQHYFEFLHISIILFNINIDNII